jgi:hypothetical protein
MRQECGSVGAGKSTLADMVFDEIARFPGPKRLVARMSLAEPLKAAVSAVWDIDGFNPDKETPIDVGLDKPITLRRLLQLFGTVGIRKGFGEAIEAEGYAAPGKSCVWARALVHRARSLARKKRKTAFVVIDDLRFPDELDAVIEGASIVIHVDVSRRVEQATQYGGYVSEVPLPRRSPDASGSNGARFFTYSVENDSLSSLRDAAHTWALLAVSHADKLLPPD